MRPSGQMKSDAFRFGKREFGEWQAIEIWSGVRRCEMLGSNRTFPFHPPFMLRFGIREIEENEQ
jgi:hypothetical protein